MSATNSLNFQTEQLQTARDWVLAGEQAFAAAGLYYGHGADNPLDDALALVRYAAAIDWRADESAYDQALDQATQEQIARLYAQRIQERIPVPYLTHEAWFAGLPFIVSPDVLIPRSPVAELIQERFQPWLGAQNPKQILDLCTGSGCIAIACAGAFPDAQVVGTDISDAALSIAEQNRVRHGMEQRLKYYKADVFEGLPGQSFDIIVSNPPYVSGAEMQTLPDEYRHEPVLALEAADEGLAIVQRILEGADAYLNTHGLLVVEVGNSQNAVVERWPDLPITWIEFERGGDGVFIIGAEDLREWLECRTPI
ncbi:MAG: 50S ribosomal protein L3 N(5)-glutamine methyltransferase [Nevskiales bacterium]